MISTALLVVLLLLTCPHHVVFGFSFTDNTISSSPRGKTTSFFASRPRRTTCTFRRHDGISLQMALTPVGPFCPFESSATISASEKLESMKSSPPSAFAEEFAQIQEDMQLGNDPPADKLRRVATGMEESVEQWEIFINRLKLSTDFQTREFAKLSEAHLKDYGVSVEIIAVMMKWQAACMRAMADNLPPPMPPPQLDLNEMMKQRDTPSSKPPSLSAMQEAVGSITASPFDPKYLESDTVREEYQQLAVDHAKLIEFGSKYSEFDGLGKIAFLDEIEKVEERWDSFFFRFKLMDAIDKDYKEQCDAYLASMNMDEEGFKNLLKKCHQLMREEAEKERDRDQM